MALRKVLEAVQGMDMKRQGIAIEEASQALGVLRARVRKQKELALRVGEGEKKEREKMEDMERETVECHMTTAGLLRQAEEVREDILSVRKEIEVRFFLSMCELLRGFVREILTLVLCVVVFGG